MLSIQHPFAHTISSSGLDFENEWSSDETTRQAVVAVSRLTCIREVPSSDTAILTEDFHGFSKSFQTSAEIVPWNRYGSLYPLIYEICPEYGSSMLVSTYTTFCATEKTNILSFLSTLHNHVVD
jgi:hypothetical protein